MVNGEPACARRGALLAGAAIILLIASQLPLPARLGLPSSVSVHWRDGSTAHVFLSSDDKWRIPVRSGDVDPDFVRALVKLEDRHFWWHPGVDGGAVVRAAGQDLSAGAVVSGASTLTMQLARLLEPRPRTLRSKSIEMLRATQLEWHFSKTRILAEYLSHVPFGRNVEGVEAAALWIFGHSAAELSPAEIATLLAIPQDPTDRYPTPEHQPGLTRTRDAIAERIFDPLTAEEVRRTPTPTRLQSVPRNLPLTAEWLRRRTPGEAVVHTTLDRGVQRVVDSRVDAMREELDAAGIHNAAVLVAERESGELRAMRGNLDPDRAEDGGGIVSFDVPRSPGSTLKPLLYAAALDRQLVLPSTLLEDVPVNWGSYRPQNYDGAWNGLVPAEEALSRSLNVPFVGLLARFGVDPFLGLLRLSGVQHLDPRPGSYGLALIAGGVEMSALDLLTTYTALAGDGRTRPLRWRPEASDAPGPELVSPGAAWLTRRALRLRDRPDFPSRRDHARLPLDLVWKTGTSFGNRDAWAVGAGQKYVAAVWLGNLDMSPSVHLVGAEVAAPLLFDVLEGLHDGRTSPDRAPRDLGRVDVCGLSGHLPGPDCPSVVGTIARPAALPVGRCPLHRRIEVDSRTGFQVTPSCAPADGVVSSVVVAWPPGVRRWLGARFPTSSELPGLAPGCAPPSNRSAPRIRSPAPDLVAVLIPGVDPRRQEIPFEADADPSARLSWFVDGALIGRAGADEVVWWTPGPGVHRVRVMDEAGEVRERQITVR